MPFNRPATTPTEITLLRESLASGHISGDGPFTQRASSLLSGMVGGSPVLLTPSCTDALEMAALLCELQPGDEVIVPSFTFVSTANAFLLSGAVPVFADSDPVTMNMSPESVERVATTRTRAVVVVHYGGVPCEMDFFTQFCRDRDLILIEDNAHGLLGVHRDRPLGTFGDLSCLSFHETKNFSSGEGGALVVNSPALLGRAEILREKGTNRSAFFRGAVDKYTWVDLGSSYLMADPLAALLVAQLQAAEEIQGRRHAAWTRFDAELFEWADNNRITLGSTWVTEQSIKHPAHLFWMRMPDADVRHRFIAHMRRCGVQAAFHYQALNVSPMGLRLGGALGECPVAESASDTLVRLPLFSDIRADEVELTIEAARAFAP